MGVLRDLSVSVNNMNILGVNSIAWAGESRVHSNKKKKKKLFPFHSFRDFGKTALQNVAYVLAGIPLKQRALPLSSGQRAVVYGDAFDILTARRVK